MCDIVLACARPVCMTEELSSADKLERSREACRNEKPKCHISLSAKKQREES